MADAPGPAPDGRGGGALGGLHGVQGEWRTFESLAAAALEPMPARIIGAQSMKTSDGQVQPCLQCQITAPALATGKIGGVTVGVFPSARACGVARDICRIWQVLHRQMKASWDTAAFNFPGAGYAQDAPLIQLIGSIESVQACARYVRTTLLVANLPDNPRRASWHKRGDGGGQGGPRRGGGAAAAGKRFTLAPGGSLHLHLAHDTFDRHRLLFKDSFFRHVWGWAAAEPESAAAPAAAAAAAPGSSQEAAAAAAARQRLPPPLLLEVVGEQFEVALSAPNKDGYRALWAQAGPLFERLGVTVGDTLVLTAAPEDRASAGGAELRVLRAAVEVRKGEPQQHEDDEEMEGSAAAALLAAADAMAAASSEDDGGWRDEAGEAWGDEEAEEEGAAAEQDASAEPAAASAAAEAAAAAEAEQLAAGEGPRFWWEAPAPQLQLSPFAATAAADAAAGAQQAAPLATAAAPAAQPSAAAAAGAAAPPDGAGQLAPQQQAKLVSLIARIRSLPASSPTPDGSSGPVSGTPAACGSKRPVEAAAAGGDASGGSAEPPAKRQQQAEHEPAAAPAVAAQGQQQQEQPPQQQQQPQQAPPRLSRLQQFMAVVKCLSSAAVPGEQQEAYLNSYQQQAEEERWQWWQRLQACEGQPTAVRAAVAAELPGGGATRATA